MTHILVLYDPADQAFARQLAVQLDQRGLMVLPVPEPGRPAPEPALDLQQALDDASHILGILSPSSVVATELIDRCQQALTRNKQVIGILHKPCDLPAKLRQCPVVDFQGHFLLAVEDLVEQLTNTDAPTRALSVVLPPPVAKADLLPLTLPSERCWREDRLRINYTLPIIMPQEVLELRLPAFLVEFDFELTSTDDKTIRAQRLKRYHIFDPRRAEHTLTVRRRKGSLEVYYRMTRTQVYHWFPAHYGVLDREAAALYRFLATGKVEGLRLPVDRQGRRAQVISWSTLSMVLLIFVLLIILILV